MNTTKHIRKTGATTVKKGGKIIGNIGRGKTNIPTSYNNSVQKINIVEEPPASTLSAVQEKSNTFSSKTIEYEQVQTLWNLMVDKSFAQRINILENYIDNMSDVGKNKLFKFIEDDIYIRDAYRTSSTTSHSQVIKILQGLSFNEERFSPNILDAFARYPQGSRNDWKLAVAHNLDTTAETLDFLAKSDDEWLLRNVAKNSHTTTQTITKIFVKTKYKYVLDAIAYNQNTSQKILTILSKSETRIRINVAGHKNTSTKTLSYLSKDVEPVVRHAVAQNWNTPSEILDILSYDSEIDIVWCVADNSNTPYSTLKRLAKNSNKEISNAAKFTLKLTQNILNTPVREVLTHEHL